MNYPARTLHGKHQNDDGSVTNVLATISKPKPETEKQDWSCIVHCPCLFATDKRIVGIDEGQALDLAETFLREMLEYRGVEISDAKNP